MYKPLTMQTWAVYADKLKNTVLLSWFITIVVLIAAFYFIKKGIAYLLGKMHELFIQRSVLGYDR